MKPKFSVTVDPLTLAKFKAAAYEDSLNMSLWVENRMIEYLERRDQYGKSESNTTKDR